MFWGVRGVGVPRSRKRFLAALVLFWCVCFGVVRHGRLAFARMAVAPNFVGIKGMREGSTVFAQVDLRLS